MQGTAPFQSASPFPTDLPTESLLRAAVRLCNAISDREAHLADVDSPLSPLTASSAGTPRATPAPAPAPDEIKAALDAMLEKIDELRLVPEFTDPSSSDEGVATGASGHSAMASDSSYSDGEGVDEGAAARPGGRKRKRKSRHGKASARNNGQDALKNRKKEYKKKRRRKRRQQERFDNANGAPYERRHKKAFYKRTHCVRLLNLKTFEVKYATGPGAYIGKKKFGRRVYSVQELLDMGFKELPWNGQDTIVILDNGNRIVCVLVGPPQGMTPEQRAEWDAGMLELAQAFEEERRLHDHEFAKNLRGNFDAFATGFTMGPGAKEGPVADAAHPATDDVQGPSNLDQAMNPGLRATAERLLANGHLRRLAGFASECVAHYFPLAFLHIRKRLAALCEHDPSLRFPFGGLSLYPACTFNLGPFSVCFAHTDGSNYPGMPCTVTPFGAYNAALGGHFILFDFKLFFRFPSGATVALSSAGLRHGNTALAPGDTRYGFTQYCAGSLVRYVAYGFRLVKHVHEAERERIDEDAGEGWEAQLSRFSTWSSLLVDRKRLYDAERL